MTEENEVKSSKENRGKRILILAIVVVAAFLLGFVPMGVIAYSRGNERDEARRELRACALQSSLGAAAIEARLGNYEPARVAASNFFTELRAELDRGSQSAFSEAQRENMQSLLTPRDEVITLLARSDPAAADRLTQLYVSFRKFL